MFNAGKGSVFAADGVQYMDASLMTGHDNQAGSLCGSTSIRNPIRAAKCIMERTKHVMLFGEDVHHLAKTEGLEMVPQAGFTQNIAGNNYKKQKRQVRLFWITKKFHKPPTKVPLELLLWIFTET